MSVVCCAGRGVLSYVCSMTHRRHLQRQGLLVISRYVLGCEGCVV